jgi:hypothetical protein
MRDFFSYREELEEKRLSAIKGKDFLKQFLVKGKKRIRPGQTLKIPFTIPKLVNESASAGQYTEVMFILELNRLMSEDGVDVNLYYGPTKMSLQRFKKEAVAKNLGTLKGKTAELRQWERAGVDGANFVYLRMKEHHGHIKQYRVDLVHAGTSEAKSSKEDVVIRMKCKSTNELTKEISDVKLSVKTGIRHENGRFLGGHHGGGQMGTLLPALVSGTPYASDFPKDMDKQIKTSQRKIDSTLKEIGLAESKLKSRWKQLSELKLTANYDELVDFYVKAFGEQDKDEVMYKKVDRTRISVEKEYKKNVLDKLENIRESEKNGESGYNTMESFVNDLADSLGISHPSKTSLGEYLEESFEYFNNLKGEKTQKQKIELKDKSAEMFEVLGEIIEKMGNNDKYRNNMVKTLVTGGVSKPGVDILGMNIKGPDNKRDFGENYEFAVATTLWNEGYKEFIEELMLKQVEITTETSVAQVKITGKIKSSTVFQSIVRRNSGQRWEIEKFIVPNSENKMVPPGELFRSDNIV